MRCRSTKPAIASLARRSVHTRHLLLYSGPSSRRSTLATASSRRVCRGLELFALCRAWNDELATSALESEPALRIQSRRRARNRSARPDLVDDPHARLVRPSACRRGCADRRRQVLLSKPTYEARTVNELKSLLRSHGLPTSGKKELLVARIRDAEHMAASRPVMTSSFNLAPAADAGKAAKQGRRESVPAFGVMADRQSVQDPSAANVNLPQGEPEAPEAAVPIVCRRSLPSCTNTAARRQPRGRSGTAVARRGVRVPPSACRGRRASNVRRRRAARIAHVPGRGRCRVRNRVDAR